MTRATARVNFTELIDEDLIAAVRGGEGQAFGVLVQRYNRRLFRVARGIAQDNSEAEDVLQEAYLRAYAALPSFRGASRLSTWLTRIVLNVALETVRRHRPTADLQSLDQALQRGDCCVIMFPGVNAEPNPEAAAARAEVRRLLERAVDDLPEPFRLVLIMRDVEEMSTQETADSLGIRSETVKTRLHRARRLLRRGLTETLSTALKDAFPFAGSQCARITSAVMGQLDIAFCPPSNTSPTLTEPAQPNGLSHQEAPQ